MKCPLIPRLLSVAMSVVGAAGCAALPHVGPDYSRPDAEVPQDWQALQPNVMPLAHGGSTAQLADWWRQFDDAALLALIEAAQRQSPTLAQAGARIERARAEAVAAGAAGTPTLDAQVGAKRAALSFGGPLIHQTSRQIGLMANWEIDLFGGVARAQEAAAANLDASRARWHEARVSIAAETANAYLQYRFHERRLAQSDADATSRRQTAALTDTLGKAGFQAPANVALANASAAEAASTLTDIRAQRDMQIKALVALSGIEEPALRARLAERSGQFPVPARFRVDRIPAQVLAQRPDVAAAERELAAASAAIGQAQAARYPRLTLAGSVTPVRLNTDGVVLNTTTWSIGPSLMLPIFDGGRINANVDAVRAQYSAAEAAYRQKARDAVREVEQALVRLASAGDRQQDVARAAEGYRAAFAATEARHKVGLASIMELEESRRMVLAADNGFAAWQQELVAAWVALYRAVGGGWTADTPVTTAQAPAVAPR